MFDVVEKHRSVVKILLVLIALTFVTFGVTQCDPSGQDYIVKVGNQKISKEEISQIIRNNQLDAGNEIRLKIFKEMEESAYFKEGLKDLGMGLTDDYVKKQIISIPFLQIDGKFDQALFQQYLQKTGKKEAKLINDIKNETFAMISNSLISTNSMMADSQINSFARSMYATRNTQTYLFQPQQYMDQVQINDTKLQAFYKEHQEKYIEPMAVKFSTLVIDPNLLAKQIEITPESIKTYFETNQNLKPQREISHILFLFPANVDNQIKNEIKQQAQLALNELRKKPEQFAHFARHFSQDPGTAKQGGSLGRMSKGANLVPEFEQVAFSLNNNQISDLVETEYGFHIIKASSILNRKSLAEDTPAIKSILQLEQAKKGLSEIIENVAEAAFNNPDELETAKKVASGLIIEQETQWQTKQSLQQTGLTEEFINTLFSEEVLEKKHNSDLITIGLSSIIVRVDEVKAEKQLSFDQVKETVKTDYTHTEAKKLASQAADNTIKDLQANKPVDLNWTSNIDIDLNTASIQFPSEGDFKAFINAKPKDNKPEYVLIKDLPTPVILRINHINYSTNDDEKIKTNIQQIMMPINISILKENYLNYLRNNVSFKKGLQKVEE